MASAVIVKITEMFVIFLCGVLVYKIKLIDAAAVRKMSDLLLMFITPLLIFQSYQVDFDAELLHGLLATFAASALSYLICIVLSELLFRKRNSRTPVEKAAVVYSNCAFIGIPLVSGILGSEGVFYLTAFTTIFNLLLWTHGVLIMNPKDSSPVFNPAVLKNLLTPAIFAVLAGLLCFVLQLRLPSVLSEPFDMIASMNTPLAMIIAGANLAQGHFLQSLKNRRLYMICFVKLILFPVATLLALSLLPLSFPVVFTVFIAVACPTGATTIMFADRYHQDAPYASEIFVMTTAFSAVTIPLLSILAEQLLR